MSASEPPANRCPRCRNELPPEAPGGVCPACAFGEALSESPVEGGVDRLSLEDIPVPAKQEAFPAAAGAVKPDKARSLPRRTRDKPGDRIGRYKLLEEIGEGGCGVVYVAEQEQPVRRRVALKVIKLGMDTREVIARFEAERQALAMMDHPNIAKVLDAGATETGRPYFVMELVKGVRITDYCDRNNLATTERLSLFIPVCHAIQHAHQKGIIHRDIKPSNILVTLHDGVPVPKVIDFGIAKATTNQRLTDKTVYTAINQFIGTAAYMSPEQAELSGLDIDTRSDIYALGVLLYELLTGKTPFDSKRLLEAGLDEIRRIIREEEPPRPSTRISTLAGMEQTAIAKRRHSEPPKLLGIIRGDLDWIVMRCLEKDRTRRYDTATGLADDLQRHLTNEPIVARPPSAAYKLQKFARRNRTAFAAATVVVMALLLGVIVSTWQAVRANRAKTRAEQSETKAIAAQKEAERAQVAEKQARLRADAERDAAAHNLYMANMSLAQQAWDDNNMGQLQQVLEDTKDSPYRGFEWYYWQRQTHLALKTLRGHLAVVNSVAYSPDGQRIVTGSFDRTAKVWDAVSGRELLTLKGHGDGITSVAYSPDGQRVVTGGYDETAKVWEAATGRELLTLRGHRAYVNSVAFSTDGQRIATGSGDETVKVWDTASGLELLTLKMGGMGACVAFSPDGQRIATGSWFGPTTNRHSPAKVWDATTGRELLTLQEDSGDIGSVTFSPDGQRIMTGGGDRTAKVWDAATGRELLTLKGHADMIWSLAISRDGQRIVTGSRDGTAKVWEAASGRELLTLKGHGGWVHSVAFSPDGERIVTGSTDGTARVWDSLSAITAEETGGNRFTLRGHGGDVSSVKFSLDGQRIVTGSFDKTAKVWEVASGRELSKVEGVRSVALSPDGQRIVTRSRDGTAKVWEAASGRELLTLKGHGGWVHSVAFSPDGERIVTGSRDKTAKLWEAASGRELLTLKGHAGLVWFVAFSPDNRRVVTGSADKTAKVWETASGRELFTLTKVESVDISPDGQRIATTSWSDQTVKSWSDQTVKIREAASGGEMFTLTNVGFLAFSPDGQRIVTMNWDNFHSTTKVWDATSGRGLVTLKGHRGYLYAVAFSPDGQRIATASADYSAKLWDAGSGRELLTLKGHSAEVFCVAFSPDGQRLVTGSADETAKVWEAARAEQVAGWQEEERAAQSLEVLKREWEAEVLRKERSLDRESIKHWLVLGPIALAPGQNEEEGLDFEQVAGEGQLKPKAGETQSIGVGELKWLEVALDDATLDFNSVLGQQKTQAVAYAVCYLQSESEQRGLQMRVGDDADAKILLNGKEVYRHHNLNNIGQRHYARDILLNAGLNVLVFKAVSGTTSWDGSICLTDAQGNPVKGVTVTLDPEAKEKAAVKKP
jgi:WD40 repeat protein/serine/threonine protein kinase